MKNGILRLFVFLIRPFLRSKSVKGKVLVVSTTGLGDTLWAIPSLKALHEKGCFVSLLTGSYGAALFQNASYIDEVYSISNAPLFSLFGLFFKFKKKHFETIYVFHASQRTVFPFLSLLKAKTYVGFSGINKGFDHIFTLLHTKKEEHEIVSRARLLEQMGVDQSKNAMELAYTPSKKSGIILIPGSKDPYKRWSKSSFITVAQELSRKEPVYIVGNADEHMLCTEIASASGTTACTTLSLQELIDRIGNAKLVITNDTGPMHIAFATQTKTLALFSATDPLKYGPYKIDTGRVMHKRRACTPCLRRKCAENFCMQQITPNEVIQEALAWIK